MYVISYYKSKMEEVGRGKSPFHPISEGKVKGWLDEKRIENKEQTRVEKREWERIVFYSKENRKLILGSDNWKQNSGRETLSGPMIWLPSPLPYHQPLLHPLQGDYLHPLIHPYINLVYIFFSVFLVSLMTSFVSARFQIFVDQIIIIVVVVVVVGSISTAWHAKWY